MPARDNHGITILTSEQVTELVQETAAVAVEHALRALITGGGLAEVLAGGIKRRPAAHTPAGRVARKKAAKAAISPEIVHGNTKGPWISNAEAMKITGLSRAAVHWNAQNGKIVARRKPGGGRELEYQASTVHALARKARPQPSRRGKGNKLGKKGKAEAKAAAAKEAAQ